MDYEEIIEALREQNQRVFFSSAVLKDRRGGVAKGVGSIKLVGGRYQVEFVTGESDKLQELKMGLTHRKQIWMLPPGKGTLRPRHSPLWFGWKAR